MAAHKVTFIFNQSRHGWSEVWYKDASTLRDIRVPAAQLAAARSRLLGEGSKLEAIRIATVDKPYKHILQPFKAPESFNGSPTDQAPACVLARLHDLDLAYSRLVTLRGCPDIEITYDEAGNPEPIVGVFADRFQQFVTELKQLGFGWKARSVTGAGGTLHTVNGMSLDGSRRLTFDIPGFTGAVGEKFTLSGFVGDFDPSPNGTHQIRSNAAGIVTTNTVMPIGWEPNGWTLGKARLVAIAYPLPETGVLLRPGKRDTGRAFFVSRGRRPASK